MMNKLIYKLAENEKEYEGMRKVRQRVFVEEQGIPDNLVFGGDPGKDNNLVVVLEGESVIGTARMIFSSHDTAKIERMAVLDKYRNCGVGSEMMRFMVSEIENRGYDKVYLHAQSTAVDFYRSCGFHDTGEPFEEAGIRHIKMELIFFRTITGKSNFLEHP